MTRVMRRRFRGIGIAGLVAGLLAWPAAPAAAQDNPNTGDVSVTAGFDVLNAYHFRGIPQDEGSFGSVMWPYADLGFGLFSGDGGVESVGVNVGTWNSLHTGATGLDGPSGELWYESDFYATLGFGFAGGASLGVTYTAYLSPNDTFGTVKELALKLGVDDSDRWGGAALSPYVLVAFELDGQADGGNNEGTYLELGVAPGYSAPRFSLAVPIKVGLSLADYYELAGDDQRFGFFSLGGLVTVPFTSAPTRLGSWNVHGGVEYLRLGDFNQAFGENQVIGSIGLGFSY